MSSNNSKKYLKSHFLISATIYSCTFFSCDHFRPNPNPDPCSTLAGSNYIETSIIKPLCIARDSSGKYYVIDNPLISRLFISSGDTLYRYEGGGCVNFFGKYNFAHIPDGREIIYKNENNIWSDVYYFNNSECTKCSPLFLSLLDSMSDTANAFALGWKKMCNYLDNNNENCLKLDIANAGDIQNYIVRNFPPVTHLEFLAITRNNCYLLITRPEYDWNGSDFAVHYGPLGKILSCENVSGLQARSGIIRFMINSEEAIVQYKFSPLILIYKDTLELDTITPSRGILEDMGFNCSNDIRF